MNRILEDIGRYYTQKLVEHGPTHRGVDWNSQESQDLRFQQLIKILPDDENSFSILDYGCGYGALYSFLSQRFATFQYTGFDVSHKMIAAAKNLYGDKQNCDWTTNAQQLTRHDYAVASGIFNVRLEYDNQTWKEHICKMLQELNQLSQRGFSFNMLTTFSDSERMRNDLFYGDPAYLFDYCKRQISSAVALLHDYPLYEFTILVRKET